MKTQTKIKFLATVLLSVSLFYSCSTPKDDEGCKSVLISGINYTVFEYIGADSVNLGQIGFSENSSDVKQGTYVSSFLGNGLFSRTPCELIGSKLTINEQKVNGGAVLTRLEVTITGVGNVISNGYYNTLVAESTDAINGVKKKYKFMISTI